MTHDQSMRGKTMLELRPSCENCNVTLPPDAPDARICSFECTFCARCAQDILLNVCPNCGGGFERRPVRPLNNWKNNNCLRAYPPSTSIKYRPVDAAAHALFADRIAHIEPPLR
jgi:uncharacterized protein